MYKARNTGTEKGMPGTRRMVKNVILRGMLLHILANFDKNSGKYPQTFRGMLPMFGVNEENYWVESHLESCQTSMMEVFYGNSQRP